MMFICSVGLVLAIAVEYGQATASGPTVGIGNSDKVIDMVFVMETAASDFNWRGVANNRRFVTKHLLSANLSLVQVGVIAYNENVTKKMDLEERTDRRVLYQEIDSNNTVPWVDSDTSDLFGALTLAESMLSNGRQNVEKQVVVVTRGRAFSESEETPINNLASNFKQNNIRVSVIFPSTSSASCPGDNGEPTVYSNLATSATDCLGLGDNDGWWDLRMDVYYN